MKLKNYWNLISGKTKALKPAKITWSNVKAVFQSWFRKARRNLGGLDLPDHIYEQIIWRRFRVIQKSPRCWDEGQCIVCGCDILGKTMEDRACEDSCYPPMMDAEAWKNYKEVMDIKLFY